MRFSGRLACLLLGIFGLSILTAPLAKLGVEWLQHTLPQTIPLFGFDSTAPTYDFGRIYRRLVLILALVLGYMLRNWLGPFGLRGVGPRSDPGRHCLSGLLLGCVSFSLFLGTLIVLGEHSVAPNLPAHWPSRIGLALAAALLVGVIEETIFRGALLGGFLQERSEFVAVILSSGLYSATHFLRGNIPVAPGLDLGVGLRALLAHFRSLADPATLSPFIGLSLAGLILAYAYLWTDSLPFAIGLHAGWVLTVKIDAFVLQEQNGIAWLYGPHGILAGGLGWLFLLVMLLLLRLWIHIPRGLMKPRRT